MKETNMDEQQTIFAAKQVLAEIRDWYNSAHTWLDATPDEREYMYDPNANKVPANVLIRSDWYSPGTISRNATHYQLILWAEGIRSAVTGILKNNEPYVEGFDDMPTVTGIAFRYQYNLVWHDMPIDYQDAEALHAYASTFKYA